MRNFFKVALVAALAVLASVSASAAIATYDLVAYDEANNQWEVTATVNIEHENPDHTCRVQTFTTYFTYNPNKLVLNDTNYAVIADPDNAGVDPLYLYPVKSGRNEYTYTAVDAQDSMWQIIDENNIQGYITVGTQYDYFDPNNVTPYSIAFSFADGVTKDDLVASDFVIKSVFVGDYGGDTFGYNYTNYDCTYELFVVNNVVPEAVAITIPVQAGDKIYLQDGTVETAAETTDAYEVPATVGYVAVNTGNTAQATWYVDGTSATKVHTNGVFDSAVHSLRDRTPVYDKATNTTSDRNGMRFKLNHNPAGREESGHEIVEVGFIITAESAKVLEKYPDGYTLDMEMVNNDFAKKGAMFGDGRNAAMDTEDDDAWILAAVFYNIPITEAGVQTKIVARPYYKVGETYIYGEIAESTLYDEAKAIKDDAEKWAECDESKQDYINEILFQVDGTEIVTDEVIIDISGLYN